METWFRRLSIAIAASVVCCSSPGALAQDSEDVLADIISPDLERREIREARIDSEDIEFTAYGGVISVEDFGSNILYGGAFAYHINEDLFMEAAYGKAELAKTSSERLSDSAPLLADNQRKFSYYNLSLGWNLFPGEYFIFDEWSLNSGIYLIGGIGNTGFADRKHLTYNIGAGVRILTNDWLALRLDFRDHIFDHDLFGEKQTTHNISAQFGLSFFF